MCTFVAKILFSAVRYDQQMEEFLDEAYERYAARKGGSTTQRKRAKLAYSEKENLMEVLSFGHYTSF